MKLLSHRTRLVFEHMEWIGCIGHKNISVGQHKNAIFLSHRHQHQTSACHTIYHYNFFCSVRFFSGHIVDQGWHCKWEILFSFSILVNPFQKQPTNTWRRTGQQGREKKLKLMHYDLHERRNVRRMNSDGGWQMPPEKMKKYDKWVFD